MRRNPVQVSNSVVLFASSNLSELLSNERLATPARLLSFIQTLQEHLATALAHSMATYVSVDLVTARAVWRIDHDPLFSWRAAIQSSVQLIERNHHFNHWAEAEGLPGISFGIGLDLGRVISGEDMVLSETVTSASAFSGEALRCGVPVIMAVDRDTGGLFQHAEALQPRVLAIAGVNQRQREIVAPPEEQLQRFVQEWQSGR